MGIPLDKAIFSARTWWNVGPIIEGADFKNYPGKLR